ncbi:MAG: hypothetical protein A4E19_15595 [Nitrospira sp. SG-bin1]|nr:MAG: hypothetical protein A4E19_15595 [Nitrospira sp. SG-bin1]
MASSTLDDLLEVYSHVSARNRTVLAQFALIARRFHQEGIAFIVLKGADVLPRLYGVRGARPLSDVDLLTHESDLPAIDRLLRDLDFTQQIDGNPSYVSSDRSLTLDLTTNIWYLDARGLADLWSRAPTRQFDGTPISYLDTADLLIYLTAYAVIHRGELSAAFVQDVKLLIEKEAPAWPTVVARTKGAMLQVPLFHGLHHVRTIIPTVAIPDTVLALLAPMSWNELMLTWLLRKLVTPTPLPEVGHLLLFCTQPGLNKLAWLKQRFYPSSVFLSYRYGAAAQARPWRMRLLRIRHLLGAALLLSGRVFKRLTTLRRPCS